MENEVEASKWDFRPQDLWWSEEALALRRQLFRGIFCQNCDGVCRPMRQLSPDEYRHLLRELGEGLCNHLRQGQLREGDPLLMVGWLIMCMGFPPIPTLQWLLTWALENIPEKVSERLRTRPKGATPVDVIDVYLDPPEKKLTDRWENLRLLPPVYRTLGCGSWQEMQGLSLRELWRRWIVEGRWRSMSIPLVQLSLAHQADGQESSISRDRQIPFSKIEEQQKQWAEQRQREGRRGEPQFMDSRWADRQGYQELRWFWEETCADAPASEGRAGRLALESHDTGESFRQVSLQHGENPNIATANLHRLRRRARQKLSH